MKNIKRILLVFPPMLYRRAQSRKTAIFPLGLGHLAAMLERTHEVAILDSALEGFGNELEQGNGLSLYGLSDRDYQDAVARFKPDLVGISCLFSSLHRQMLRAARLAKEAVPGVVTVVGGPHPSALPELVLQDPAVDYCVIGEGERPLAGLIERLQTGAGLAGLDGIAFRDGGRIICNSRLDLVEDLDELPFPAFHLCHPDRYIDIGSVQGLRMEGLSRAPRLIQVNISRGCPHSCSYCGKYAVWGRRFRAMSPGRAVEYLEWLVEEYGVERVAFQDDNLTFGRERALEMFGLMRERKLPVTWEAHNGLAFSALDEEVLDAMAASGCVSFTGAVESGSKEVLARINKKVDLERAIELADYARSIGLDVRAFYIIGFPGETLEEIEATRSHMRRLGASVSALALYTPLPGSPLYQELEERGIIDSASMDFEKLSFGAFDQQLSEVSIPELHRIRKIDWLMNVFADEEGNLKSGLEMTVEVMTRELKNGLDLYPDAKEIKKLYEQALSKC